MGTNRRSRRRSAARILNPSIQPKKQRTTSELELEDDSDLVYPQPPISPDPYGPTTNFFDQSDEADPTNVQPSTICYDQSETSCTTRDKSSNVISKNSDPIFTTAEICSFELMDLLDNAGCPLNTYEQVVCLLRKQEKLGFSYSRAHSRDKLLCLLRQKFHCPSIHSTIISKCEVFSFPFVDMLQDLVDTAWNHLHTITPFTCNGTDDELWNSRWMNETFRLPSHSDFNPQTDIMLPIILFLDKTGTDVLQRYSLEPMLFTTTALKRDSRENRRFWRHLGFVPSSKNIDDSKDSLQFYHQCLGVILNGLKLAQQAPPILRIKNKIDGTTQLLKAHLPLMIILGDQLSQDTLCCRRKANAGGAGRVHRSCMCSYLSTDDHDIICEPVPMDLIQHMIQFSNRSLREMEDIIDHEKQIPELAAA